MNSDSELSRRSVLSGIAVAGFGGLYSSLISNIPHAQDRVGLVKRGDFAFPSNMTYMNTGSVGPSPKVVLEKMVDTWHQIESSPVVESYSKGNVHLDEVRHKIASFLNCEKEDIVFTGCTTDGMNRLSFALGLQPGEKIISTDQEHEGGHDCWKFHARSRGIVVEDISIRFDENDAQSIVDRFEKAITPNTRAISFSHVLYTNGLRLPAAEICEMARRKGVISIVDGAQAIGAVSVDIANIRCDAYAAPGHKWLLGPKGTGFMFVRRASAPHLNLLTRLTNNEPQSDTTGLMNHMGFQGLGAAIDYVNRIGVSTIEKHNLVLHTYAFDRIQTLPLKSFSPREGALAAPLLAFKIDKKFDTRALIAELLAKENLVIKALPKLNALRLSTHLFNSKDDIDKTFEILKRRLV